MAGDVERARYWLNSSQGYLEQQFDISDGTTYILKAKNGTLDYIKRQNGTDGIIWTTYASMGVRSFSQSNKVTTFKYSTTFTGNTIASRVPVLILIGNQGNTPEIMMATLIGDGSGFGSSGVSVSNYVVTVNSTVVSGGGWAITTVLYDPRVITIMDA